MIAAGFYKAKAVTWALGETSTGKEQVAVEFALFDEEGVEGPHMTWFGYFTDNTTESTLKALRTCGWVGTDLSDLQGLDANEVQLVIEHETYDGKTRAKVRWVNPVGQGGLALKSQMDGAKAKAFAAKMRSRIAAFDQSAAVRPSAPSSVAMPAASRARSGVLSPEPPPFAESAPEDIPF